MGPKKGKEAVEDWRAIIENTPLNEENWKVKVVMIEAAGGDQDRIYMNKFEIFAAEEKRFVVKNICKTETIFMVNQLGGEKKVKDDNLRVFEEGQSYLKEKLDIPPDIQALIIKHLILKMKEEYIFIKRQRLECKEGMRRESKTMIDRAEVRGTVNVKPPEPVDPSPPSTKVKGKKEDPNLVPPAPEPEEGKKYNTLLRVRGEEWRDKVYVDDFPTDGPNLYVAVTGFVEPLLPSSLVKIGIPLTAIIQVRIDPVLTKVPSGLQRATKRGQSQTEILTEKSFKFWDDLQLLRINKNTADDFKDTAFIVFSPPYWESESLSGHPDKIYDELCFLMYDCQDLTRQHEHYLENMDIVQVPKIIEGERYEKYYHQQIDDVPLECVSIYSVLDSILNTVCRSQDIQDDSSRTSLSTAVTLNQNRKSLTSEEKIEKAGAFVKEVFNTLCKTDANRKAYRLTYGEEYENHKDPTVINYGDLAKYSTFHLGNINLDNIVWTSLIGMPLLKFWDNQPRPHGELEAKINFHVNVLLSCFQREDVETSELNRLIHILACRKIYNNRSSLKKKHLPPSTITDFKKIFLKRSVLAEPLARVGSLHRSFSSTVPSFPSMSRSENISNPSYGDDTEARRIKFIFDCPDISELVSAAELANETPINHLIDDFEYFEDFSGVSAFQILFDAFNKFNCVDYKYCEVTDCFVLMFFNSHDKDGISREEWRCHLATPLCLQDFFDFVLEENYDWIETEEKIYDEAVKLKSQSESKVVVDPNANKSCVDDIEVELDLLMEGSLKFQELAEVEEEPVPDQQNTRTASSQKSSVSPTSNEIDSKSSRKPKPTTPTPRTLKQSFIATDTSESSLVIPPKPFLGYDLCDRRVEVFGKDATYFSRDGTRVQSMYMLIIPSNVEYIIMNVVPGNSVNQFWLYRALGENVTPEIMNSCESFRITSKDQVMIYIKQQAYTLPLPLTTVALASDTQQLFETKTYHSFFVTWPNGLITESVYENNSTTISHIKQYHTSSSPNLNEKMRCISLNGEVLVFRPSGDIDVLKPDGTFIKIIKYDTRTVVPEKFVDLTSDTSSDKSKKGKGKEKVKAKPAKSTSKSKEVSDDKEEEVQPQYELVVEEFELIETTGLRQKWINENPFTIEKLLIRTATDFCLGEVFSRRMDGTRILLNKDGIHIVTFPNNTRIITKYIVEDEEIYPEWTDEEIEFFDVMDSDTVDTDTIKSNKGSISQKSYTVSQASIASSYNKKVDIRESVIVEESKTIPRVDGYISVQIIYTIEHANFTTVTINKADGNISVESPNETVLVVDSENNYKITLDSATTASFNGESLNIKYEACPECQAFTLCDVKIKTDEMSSVTKFQQNWLKLKDSFSKKIVVNEEGSISLVDEPYSDEALHTDETVFAEELVENVDERQADRKSESSFLSHGKCREMYLAKTIRFFIMRRELTCSELLHRSLLDLYKRDCRWQPWCSINQYDTFGDRRSLLSLLTPVHLTETEKWLMESKFASKPKYLTYKDLKKDCGKGFYHWMRPYERFEPKPMKPENVLPPGLPRAFILRTVEQQWKETERDSYKGAKELLNAIFRYRRIIEEDNETLLHVPIVDQRPEEERHTDDVIQALAHRIYEDLKYRLAEDVQSRAKANVTVRATADVEEVSVEGELEEEETDELTALEEHRYSLVKQVEDVVEMSAVLKKYWRRRAEEQKEEEFFKYLLREGNVPPYFRNVLGGAIWWEMNHAADEAVSKAERRKMKCTCAEEMASNETAMPYM